MFRRKKTPEWELGRAWDSKAGILMLWFTDFDNKIIEINYIKSQGVGYEMADSLWETLVNSWVNDGYSVKYTSPKVGF